jgi:hypothetical protein
VDDHRRLSDALERRPNRVGGDAPAELHDHDSVHVVYSALSLT